MAKRQRSYGIGSPFKDVFAPPVLASRAPLSTDTNYEDGQIWVFQSTGAVYIKSSTTSGSAVWGQASAGSSGDMSLGGDLILTGAVKQIQMEGGAVTDFIGQGTLVAGTVTIANTNIAAGDRIIATRSALNASPALGDLITTISAGASFTVASYDAVGVAETTDVSSFDYVIIREN